MSAPEEVQNYVEGKGCFSNFDLLYAACLLVGANIAVIANNDSDLNLYKLWAAATVSDYVEQVQEAMGKGATKKLGLCRNYNHVQILRNDVSWHGWPDTPESRMIIAKQEARDPFSACAWDRVVIALTETSK